VMFKKASGRVDIRNHYNWWVYVPARTGVIRAVRQATFGG